MALQRGLTHAQAVGQPTGAERESGHSEIESRKEQADLCARKPQLVFVERRQRVDGVLSRGANHMGHADQRQDSPAKRITARRHVEFPLSALNRARCNGRIPDR